MRPPKVQPGIQDEGVELFDRRVVEDPGMQLRRPEIPAKDQAQRQLLVFPIPVEVGGTAAALHFETAVGLEEALAVRQPHLDVGLPLISLFGPGGVDAGGGSEEGVDARHQRHDGQLRQSLAGNLSIVSVGQHLRIHLVIARSRQFPITGHPTGRVPWRRHRLPRHVIGEHVGARENRRREQTGLVGGGTERNGRFAGIARDRDQARVRGAAGRRRHVAVQRVVDRRSGGSRGKGHLEGRAEQAAAHRRVRELGKPGVIGRSGVRRSGCGGGKVGKRVGGGATPGDVTALLRIDRRKFADSLSG